MGVGGREAVIPNGKKFYEGPYIVLERTRPLSSRVQRKPRGRIFVTHMDKMLLYKSREELNEARKNADGPGTGEASQTGERNISNDGVTEPTLENTEGHQESEKTEIQYQRPRREIRRPARFNDYL